MENVNKYDFFVKKTNKEVKVHVDDVKDNIVHYHEVSYPAGRERTVSDFLNTFEKPLITRYNLNEKSLTNGEVIEMLKNLSLKLDGSGFSRVTDVIENLTANRNF